MAAGVGGGGVYFDPLATGSIARSVISGNQATGNDGGGVFVLGATAAVTIDDTVISGNRAASAGGGIYVDSAPVTLHNLLLSGNRSDGNGGAMAFYSGGGASATNLTVVYNQSAGSGGGVDAFGAQPAISDSVFFNNREGGRTVANAASAGDTFCDLTHVQSNYNLVEIDADGGMDIDLTAAGRTPDFVGGYYLAQGSSLGVDSGSRSAIAAALDDAFTATDGSPDSGVVDRGWHYAAKWPGVADSLGVLAPAVALTAFDPLPQAVTVQPRAGVAAMGSGREVVFRLVSAPPGFAWSSTTTLEPSGPGTVLAHDAGDGAYQARVNLGATGSGSIDLEVLVDGTSAGIVTIPVTP